MHKLINDLLNTGSQYYTDSDDKRRLRLANLINFSLLFFVIPPIITMTLWKGEFRETASISIVILALLIAIILTSKGYNQLAIIGSSFCGMASICYVTAVVPHQNGAPYGNLLIGLGAIFFIKRRIFRLSVLAISTLSFLLTNYYQLKYKPFDEIEYIAVFLMLFLFFIVIAYYDQLMTDYQNTIKEQASSLLDLEKEKHEHEIMLKQKDLDVILNSASVRDQLVNNVSTQLQEALRSENVVNDIKRVIREINIDSDLHSKLSTIRENVHAVNADFYERLKNQFEGITKSERELCGFLKLGLSNKEIANIKNSTTSAVNVSKARLRRKLGIESNKELQEFLFGF